MDNKESIDNLQRSHAMISVVLGFISWFIFTIPLSLGGLVVGILAVSSKDKTAKTCGIIGIVICSIALFIALFWGALVVTAERYA